MVEAIYRTLWHSWVTFPNKIITCNLLRSTHNKASQRPTVRMQHCWETGMGPQYVRGYLVGGWELYSFCPLNQESWIQHLFIWMNFKWSRSKCQSEMTKFDIWSFYRAILWLAFSFKDFMYIYLHQSKKKKSGSGSFSVSAWAAVISTSKPLAGAPAAGEVVACRMITMCPWKKVTEACSSTLGVWTLSGQISYASIWLSVKFQAADSRWVLDQFSLMDKILIKAGVIVC